MCPLTLAATTAIGSVIVVTRSRNRPEWLGVLASISPNA
jgi:hypothetical protein